MASRPTLGVVFGFLLLAVCAGPVASAAAQDVQCAGVLTGVTVRNVTVPANGACILRDAKVTGSVRASGGSYFQAIHSRIAGDVAGAGAQTLFVEGGSTVRGSIRASGVAQVFVYGTRVRKSVKVDRATDQVYICGTSVEHGSIVVTRSGRDILLGGPRAGCAGNSVARGGATVIWNRTDVQLIVSGNRFPKGDLVVSGNTGPSQKIVQGNSGGRRIACQANAGFLRASQNRRWKNSGCQAS
jgi:hypothetical protein